MTLNHHWGYKKNDDDWKSASELVRTLVDIVSKGGNFLLNVGPTGEGLIPAPSIERLHEVGQWMKVNAEAIYGTTASPFKRVDGWRCTSRSGKLYVIIFDWPTTGRFELPGLESRVTKAYLLAGHQDLKFSPKVGGVSIDLPMTAPDNIASVLCVEVADATAKVTPAR